MKCRSNYVDCPNEAEIGKLCKSCLEIEYEKNAEQMRKKIAQLPIPKQAEIKDWRPDGWQGNEPPIQRKTDS